MRSTPGGISKDVESQATAAAANNTAVSWKQARKSSWDAGRGEDVGTGEGGAGLGAHEGDPLLREEVKYSLGLESTHLSSPGGLHMNCCAGRADTIHSLTGSASCSPARSFQSCTSKQ